MKKHWYDYLWIASLTYLILGFFNILFAWLGLLCFFYTIAYLFDKRDKRLLQSVLWQRTAFCTARRAIWPLAQEGYSKMDEK